jgi:hypothetical protein
MLSTNPTNKTAFSTYSHVALMRIMVTTQTGIDGSAIFKHTLRVQLIRTESDAPGGNGPRYRTAARIKGPGRLRSALPLRRAPIHKAERPTTKVKPAKMPSTCTQAISASLPILLTGAVPGLS